MWSRRRVRWAAAVAAAVLLVSLLSVPASAQASTDANLSSLKEQAARAPTGQPKHPE